MALSKTQASSHAWCYTGPEPDTTTVYYWTIDNFMRRTAETSPKMLTSDVFYVKEEEFRIELHPRGNNTQCVDFVRYIFIYI